MRHPHESLIFVMRHVTDALAVLAILLFTIGVILCVTGKGGM